MIGRSLTEGQRGKVGEDMFNPLDEDVILLVHPMEVEENFDIQNCLKD